MSELSAALGDSAPKHHILCGDKRYPVRLVTQAVKVGFEKLVYEKARAATASIRDITDKEHYHKLINDLLEMNKKGGFSMEAPYGKEVMESPSGAIVLLSLLMGSMCADGKTIEPMPEMDVLKIVAQAPDETNLILRTVMQDSFPGVEVEKVQGTTDPKA